MIVSSSQQKIHLEERLRAKTMEQMFLGSIQEGANCPPLLLGQSWMLQSPPSTSGM